MWHLPNNHVRHWPPCCSVTNVMYHYHSPDQVNKCHVTLGQQNGNHWWECNMRICYTVWSWSWYLLHCLCLELCGLVFMMPAVFRELFSMTSLNFIEFDLLLLILSFSKCVFVITNQLLSSFTVWHGRYDSPQTSCSALEHHVPLDLRSRGTWCSWAEHGVFGESYRHVTLWKSQQLINVKV